MVATQTANPPTFESVWALIQEVGQNQKETDRMMKELKESQKETDRQLKETERILKEQAESSNNRIGSLTNLFGDVTEAMVAPKICEKSEELGFISLKQIQIPESMTELIKSLLKLILCWKTAKRLC